MIKDPEIQAQIRQKLPFLDEDKTFCTEFMKAATLIKLPSQQCFMEEGMACSGLALITDGKVRVYKLGESGREITLYRLGSGESCVLTASCIMSNIPFPAIAVTESEVKALLIPTPIVHQWVDQYKVWRQFIFELVSQRLVDVITVIEEIAFRRMDARLASYLLEQPSDGNSALHITHQAIATELGTAREVISRLLKDFESTDTITLARGSIVLNNRDHLKMKAES
ncbi:MAG: Crp/Fnr family transcriptional regulator [Gammaproteobacteria bacterium]|nr:MAG: Crp/Fnr family transcriptional regulator [Gammaproteobacteria bacterium]RLA24116.1 MAG: Crp/Fnr family transcriptional regulator [Gammaproteobacteria bacterium]